MYAAQQQREETKRGLRAEPNNSNLRNAVTIADIFFRKVRKAAVLNVVWNLVRELEKRAREGDQIGSYRKRDRSSEWKQDRNLA